MNKYLIDHQSLIIDAIKKIKSNKSRVVFININKKIIGSFGEGDILNCLIKGTSIYAPIKSFMNKNFIFLKTKNYNDAHKIFKKELITLIPILNNKMILKDFIHIKEILNCTKKTKS
tara:strand:- start:16728 stop:17078 length:351 start_codon:yes stop_codon:yes gene_type:complete